MAFMVPQYDKTEMWSVETTCGTELIPCDVAEGNSDGLADYLEGKQLEGAEIEKTAGWFCRLSAPGYMDCTEWSGPFETIEEAKAEIESMYDVDADTGEELAA